MVLSPLPMSIIQIINLHKVTSKSNIPILNGINLEVNKGEILAITGESGCGKTSFLNIIGGLTRATKGEIIINSVEISSLPDERLSIFRNRTIGFIFQNYELLEDRTCLENVTLPLLFGDDDVNIREEGIEALEMVGLKDKMSLLAGELSGGECQRIAVARAVVNKPEIILADEPTSNLDSRTTGKIVNVLREMNQKWNTTMIVVSHNEDIFHISGKVMVLSEGNLKSK